MPKQRSSWVYVNAPAGAPNRPLRPLTERAEDVFFAIHSHFRDIDGLHADAALDELCKLLQAKLHDEQTTRRGRPFRMQSRLYPRPDGCAAQARALYGEACRRALTTGDHARPRGSLAATVRLSDVALVRAVEDLQGYDLGRSAIDLKGRAFQKVLAPAMRSGMGQYFTPDPVVRFLAEALAPTVADQILDPFCGSGQFLTACLERVRPRQPGQPAVVDDRARANLHGIEKSERMVRVALTDMRLRGDGHANVRCADALLAFSDYPDLRPESFDVILTNPPFGSVLGADAVRQLADFELAAGKATVPLEILGLERCIQLLRPGGRMGIVLPDGILGNCRTRHVRAWLSGRAKVRAIISLPIETFVPFGANIKTAILILRTWRPGDWRGASYPVFLARVDDVGYDPTGRPRATWEMQEVGRRFAEFIRAEGW